MCNQKEETEAQFAAESLQAASSTSVAELQPVSILDVGPEIEQRESPVIQMTEEEEGEQEEMAAEDEEEDVIFVEEGDEVINRFV